MNIEADGIWAILVVIMLVIVPIKAGAHMVSANKTDLLSCGIAAIVGVIASALASNLLGGAIGGGLAGFLGFILSIRFVLGTSILGAIGLSIVAVGVAILSASFLDKVF